MNTIQENAALRYIQAEVRPPDPREVNWQAKPLPFKLYRNCEQIPLGHGGTESEQIGQMLIDIYGLTRQSHSTPMFHPMLKFIPKEETQIRSFYTSLLRPVPSGGALFPCELYLLVADDGVTDGEGGLPAGIYHYDVAHHALDILAQGDSTSLLQNALAHPGDTPPAYTLLLSSYFWKDGFKYGAFGYRLQGLDIGTVISQSEIITHHAGLSSTIHYQFQDKVLNDLLGLDPLHESVYAVIEWRQGEGEVGLQRAGDGKRKAEREQKAGASPAPTIGRASFAKEEISSVGGSHTHIFGTIDASALGSNETSSQPGMESIACWPLPEEVHRASLIETREAFRPLHSLATIQLPCRGEETISLEGSRPLDLWMARSQRRSAAGTFLPTPLTKLQLSQLFLTSLRGTTNDLDGHTDFLKHTMLYCAIHRVKEIPEGIYRYQPQRHELELVRAGIRPYELYQVLRMPSLNLFYTSINLFPVGNYKSGFQVYGDRWYRMQNMEAGIIAQRIYLAAAALKLGCRATLGFSEPGANAFLGLSDTKDNQCTSLMQIMVAPEYPAHQYYEQSLLI
jgi:SagB-type dehydrogenase family enzyme